MTRRWLYAAIATLAGVPVLAHYYFVRPIANPVAVVGAAVLGAPTTSTQWACVRADGTLNGTLQSTQIAAETPCGALVAADGITRYLEERVTVSRATSTTTSTRRFEVLGGTTMKVADAHAAILLQAAAGGQTQSPAGDDGVPACEFYISTSGTGTAAGGGSIGDPWAISMLRNATAQARYAGNVVCLGDGTYCQPEDWTDFSAPYYNITGGTDNNNRTVIRATNARLAIIEGQVGCSGTNYAAQAIIGTDDEYVTLQNLTIREGSSKLVQALRSNFTLTGSHVYDVVNSREGGLSGDNAELVRVEGEAGRAANVVISHNFFHDVDNTGSGAGWQSSNHNGAFVKQYDTTGLICEYNTGHSAGSGCFEKSNSESTIVRYNFFYSMRSATHGIGGNNGWSGGTPANFTGSIHHNIFLNTEFAYDANTAIKQHVEFYNNTYYGQSPLGGSATYVLTIRETGNVADFFTYKNNIFHLTTSSGGGLVYESDSGQAVSVIDGTNTHHNKYPSTLRWLNGAYTTLGGWQTAVGGDATSTTTTAGFANAGGSTPADYVVSGAALTAGDDSGPVGAWDTGITQIGISWTP